MYSLVARLKDLDPILNQDEAIVSSVKQLAELAKLLTSKNANFADLGLIAEDTQFYIDEKIESYATGDDGIPPEAIEEFNRLSKSNRVLLNQDPEAVAFSIQKTVAELAEKSGSDQVSMSLQSSKNGRAGQAVSDALYVR